MVYDKKIISNLQTFSNESFDFDEMKIRPKYYFAINYELKICISSVNILY